MVFLLGSTAGFSTSGQLENGNVWLRTLGRTDKPIDLAHYAQLKKERVVTVKRGPHPGSVCGYLFGCMLWRGPCMRVRALATSCVCCWLDKPARALAACAQGRRAPCRACPLLPSTQACSACRAALSLSVCVVCAQAKLPLPRC